MQGLIGQAQQQGPQGGQPQRTPQQRPEQRPEQQGRQPGGQKGKQKRLDTQEAYDLAAGQMLTFVYDERGMEALTQMVQAAGDPAAGMARLFGRLLMNTVQSAAMSGKRVAPPLIFQAGIEVIRAMSEVAQSRGIVSPENEKEVAEQAFYDGIALFGQEAAEEALTDDERQEYVKLLEVAEQMEEQGGMPQQQGQQPPQQGQPRQPEGQPQQRPQVADNQPQQQARG